MRIHELHQANLLRMETRPGLVDSTLQHSEEYLEDRAAGVWNYKYSVTGRPVCEGAAMEVDRVMTNRDPASTESEFPVIVSTPIYI